jgi:predicted cupin superfamily sugar epimerase
MSPEEIIDLLGLRPHPEGGHYAETWRETPADGSRGAGSAIYFLLRGGERSEWHRVDAAETWHFYAGAPLELLTGGEAARPPTSTQVAERHILGTDLEAGERPQSTVPAHAWQSARSLGDWTLVGCTVSPAFTFEAFELWEPATSLQEGSD